MRTRLMMVALATALTLLGCRGDDAAWRARLAGSTAPRLVGLWEVRMHLDGQGADSLESLQAVGQIALTLNEERLASPLLGEPPMVLGTYNVDFAALGLGAATYAGFPGVVGRIRGDSVDLRLASESPLPIELRGVFKGDSVAGRWDAHSRAGRGGLGDFVLRRR